jgi:hypothetical protein
MLQLKMYGRFVVWLLNKLFSFGGAVPKFFKVWKENTRGEFALSLLMFLGSTVVSLAGTVIGWMLLTGDKPPAQVGLVAIGFCSIMYLCVIIAALYEVFLEEYEESFNILKKD